MRGATVFERGLFPTGAGDPAIAVLLLVAGGALLLAGRRLFWLAVGVLGFGAAFLFTETLVADLRRPWVWILAIAAGVLGSALAVTLQRIAIVVGGFLLGLLGSSYVLGWVGDPEGKGVGLLILLAGGLLMAFLASRLFALALRLITAGAGAALIVLALHPGPPFDLLLCGGLWLLGFFLQGERRSREPRSRHPR